MPKEAKGRAIHVAIPAPKITFTTHVEYSWSSFKVKLAKPEEIEELMNQEAYDKYLKEHEEE